jgi:uncharacterized protein
MVDRTGRARGKPGAALYAGRVLILLPPSEGKTVPARGAPLRLDDLGFPELTATRRELVRTLTTYCARSPDEAAITLGLGPTQTALVRRNAGLRTAAAARADRVYSGVLYEALDLATLPASARRRAASRLVVVSALLGLIRPHDRIPAYRLSGEVSLPDLGSVAGVWRSHLGGPLTTAVGDGLLVDLRSTTYAGFWRPPTGLAPRVATIRVLHEQAGIRTTVSHFNKATKGAIVRDLLASGQTPRSPAALAAVLADLGWRTEATEPGRTGTRLDVVVTELSH